MKRVLPVGIQSFEKLRIDGNIYVDKTSYIDDLVRNGSYYFLFRPRRFGKSLFLSTLEAYFRGRKELFSGLAISNTEKEWTSYPVIKIGFGGSDYSLDGQLEAQIDMILTLTEEEYGIRKRFSNPAQRLTDLICSLHEQSGHGVVILIDEYDKPILDALYGENENRNRAVLRSFYGPLKECDRHIRFCFLTGITRIDHVSIFSGLNQLDDISTSDSYSAICGITEKELVGVFSEELEALAKVKNVTIEDAGARLKTMYDGYCFSKKGEKVFNPFSVLLAFREQDYGQYWFRTATPSSLIRQLEHTPSFALSLIEERDVSVTDFTEFDSSSGKLLPLIYQSGYLTIKGYDPLFDTYRLGFPNQEVEKGFLNALLPEFVSRKNESTGMEVAEIQKAIINDDADRIMSIITSLVSDIPTMIRKDMYENYYLSIIHIIFRLVGFSVISELQSIYGRSDLTLSNSTTVYLIELKMDRGRDPEACYREGFEQIRNKGYATRYLASGRKVRVFTLLFSSEGKGVVGYREAL